MPSAPEDTLVNAIRSASSAAPEAIAVAVDAWMVRNEIGTDKCDGCPHADRHHLSAAGYFPCSLCSCSGYESPER